MSKKFYVLPYHCPKCREEQFRTVQLSNFPVPIHAFFNCPECNAYLELTYTYSQSVRGPVPRVTNIEEATGAPYIPSISYFDDPTAE